MYTIVGADGKQYKYITAEVIRQWITEGRLNAKTQVLVEGETTWQMLGDLPEFGLTAEPVVTVVTKPAPASIKVFGIINIVFGSLGLLCSPLSFVGIKASLEIMGNTPLMHAYLVFSAVWGVIGAIILLATGIGLLRRMEWARKVAVIYAIVAAVLGVIGIVITMVAFGGNTSTPAPQRIGGMIGAVIGGGIGLVYSCLLIYFMTRPEVKEALAPSTGE